MEQSQVANYLLLRIKQKLNPGYGSRRNFEQVVYVRERCSVQEYLSMFPQAKSFIVKKTKAKQLSRKFQTHRKLYEAVFTQPQQLNYLFGEDWWFVFNGPLLEQHYPRFLSDLTRRQLIRTKLNWWTRKRRIPKFIQRLTHTQFYQQQSIVVQFLGGVNMTKRPSATLKVIGRKKLRCCKGKM